jgi:hypothetical protein
MGYIESKSHSIAPFLKRRLYYPRQRHVRYQGQAAGECGQVGVAALQQFALLDLVEVVDGNLRHGALLLAIVEVKLRPLDG